ncbi:MAG TPA: hypothetical protein DDX91_10095 [Ruminococcaceae bacterium]|nr:hypothetical protein [Oscillospiraceae bacterium]
MEFLPFAYGAGGYIRVLIICLTAFISHINIFVLISIPMLLHRVFLLQRTKGYKNSISAFFSEISQ